MTDKTDKKQGNWFARHKVLTVILAFIVLSIIASAASGGDQPSTTNSAATTGESTNPNAETTEVAKIGTPVRDGKFEFTISEVKCGETTVSGPGGYLTATAQGQYCLMTIAVKNIGNEQQYFLDGDQKLLNASGQEYSTDTTATIYKADNNNVFANQINPGNTVSGVLVYDIPKDQTPVTAELHDSAFSEGVKVNL